MTQKKRLGLALPIHLYEKLKEEAEYYGKTLNATCIDIFREFFEQK